MADQLDDVNDDTRARPEAEPERTDTATGEPQDADGYFDSSMGYASEGSVSGNLNPFPYRGPGSPTDRAAQDSKQDSQKTRK